MASGVEFGGVLTFVGEWAGGFDGVGSISYQLCFGGHVWFLIVRWFRSRSLTVTAHQQESHVRKWGWWEDSAKVLNRLGKYIAFRCDPRFGQTAWIRGIVNTASEVSGILALVRSAALVRSCPPLPQKLQSCKLHQKET